jgi:hypothetical protein
LGWENRAVNIAWSFLGSFVGQSELRFSTSRGLWNGAWREPALDSTLASAQDDVDRLAQLMQFEAGEPVCALVTGAAGTGKSYLLARYAARMLDPDRDAPGRRKPRIAVLAATHYALDNFGSAFRAVTNDEIVPYRFVSRRGERSHQSGRSFDREFQAWTTRHYQREVKKVLDAVQPVSEAEQLATTRRRIEAVIATLSETPTSGKAARFQSHDRWLQAVGKLPRNSAERDQISRGLTDRLKFLDLYVDDLGGKPAAPAFDLDPYAAFMAPMIICTIDAFDTLPDVSFDLVIFEEASQLRLCKILKALGKVTRATGGLASVILSGDERQLPPYYEQLSEVQESEPLRTSLNEAQPGPASTAERRKVKLGDLRKELVRSQSPFEAMLHGNLAPKLVLSKQRRMHPSIAKLVNSLFYSDQHWTQSDPNTEVRVFWRDIDSGSALERSTDSMSRFNSTEARAVADLVREQIHPTESVLVISPYASQVDLLTRQCGHPVAVKTIDGCQGVTADVVVLSFVSLRLGEGWTFVTDPRRLNVALSRARERLYLVGSMSDLLTSLSQCKETEYPHMRGIAEAFAPGGIFFGAAPRS